MLQDPLLQEFLKMINEELQLNCIHARYSKKGNAWLYLTFPTETEQANALKLLKKYNWKGRSLISTVRKVYLFHLQLIFATENQLICIKYCVVSYSRHAKNEREFNVRRRKSHD